MKKYSVWLLVILFVTSCNVTSSKEYKALEAVNSTLQANVQEQGNVIMVLQSQTPEVKIEYVLITATSTPTPKYTATITPTPTQTMPPTPTLDPRFLPKSDGFYLIGIDIAPGVWRSTGTFDNCYWSVTRSSGDIIDNHFGMSGGTAFLPDYGFQVQFEDCGMWEYLQ